ALDSVRIGEGTRIVLIENFTNTGVNGTLADNVRAENNVFREFMDESFGSDVVKIQYHLGFPGVDPFNEENPADPSARALYYNVSTIPEVRLDGMKGPAGSPFSQWGEAQYAQRTLDL